MFIRHLHRKAYCLSLKISLSESNNPKRTVLKLTLTVDVFVKLKSQYEVGPSDSFRRHYWKRTKKKSQKDTNTRFVHNKRLHALRLQPLKWNMSNIIWINTGLVCGMALSESFSVQVEISSKVRSWKVSEDIRYSFIFIADSEWWERMKTGTFSKGQWFSKQNGSSLLTFNVLFTHFPMLKSLKNWRLLTLILSRTLCTHILIYLQLIEILSSETTLSWAKA